MTLQITKRMQGKMEGFKSLNTSPLANPFCKKMVKESPNDIICKFCYSTRAIITYAKAAQRSWGINTDILSREVLEDHRIPEIKDKVFRFHSHGELLNATHYINFCNIAWKNPNTYFTLFTKRPNLTRGIDRPPNMGLIYSEPRINNYVEEIPEGFDRRFTVFTKDYIEENEIDINCGGKKCIECLTCYTPNNGITHVNEKIKGPKKPVYLLD